MSSWFVFSQPIHKSATIEPFSMKTSTTGINNCSSNIECFEVHRIPGFQGLTGFEPQYQIELMLRPAIPRDTDVRVVRCSTPSECNIDNITADSRFEDSSCDCQVRILRPPLMRGITCRFRSEDFCHDVTTLLRFTQTSGGSEEPANVITILTMEGVSCLYGQSINEPHVPKKAV